jgi:hypothetical protein
MALMKHMLGGEANLSQQELHDGYIYFCHDTKNMWIDHLDENGVLVRSRISSEYADKLRYIKDGEVVEIVAKDIATTQYVDDKMSDVLRNSDFSDLYTDTETTLLAVLQALDNRVKKVEAYHGGSVFDRFTPTITATTLSLEGENIESLIEYIQQLTNRVEKIEQYHSGSVFSTFSKTK